MSATAADIVIGPRRDCAFCPRKATRTVSADSDTFDCCATCESAWHSNPGFMTGAKRRETARAVGR